MLPQFSDKGLTDGGEVFTPTNGFSFTPTMIPATLFCYQVLSEI
jgi:hypothetical protein